MRRAALGLALASLAPVGAAAQDEAPIPPPADPPIDPGHALGDPTAPLATPSGYGDLRIPELRARTDGRVRLDVVGWGRRALTLHLRPDGEGTAPETCTAPCRRDVLPGRYRLAVQPSGAGPRDADDQPVWIGGPRTVIQLGYDHRVGLRSVGWTLFCMAITAFGLSWIGGLWSAAIIGAPIAAGLLIPAAPLIFLEDSARVEVTPIEE